MTSFIPPSGLHDLTCEFLCTDVKPTCVHACRVCNAKRRKEAKVKTLLIVFLLVLVGCVSEEERDKPAACHLDSGVYRVVNGTYPSATLESPHLLFVSDDVVALDDVAYDVVWVDESRADVVGDGIEAWHMALNCDHGYIVNDMYLDVSQYAELTAPRWWFLAVNPDTGKEGP